MPRIRKYCVQSLFEVEKRVEDGGEYLVQEGVWVSLEHLAEKVERVEAVLSPKQLTGGVPAGRCGRKRVDVIHKVRDRTDVCGCGTCVGRGCADGVCENEVHNWRVPS